MELTICWLFGRTMNIYGDRGNVLTLVQRCQWRGIAARVVTYTAGDVLDIDACDIFFWGGGQDREQVTAARDLQGETGQALRAAVEDGAPLLAICGGYQLLGRYYQPQASEPLPGLGLFDAYTVAGSHRMIGNIVVQSEEFGELVGFENHSGKTFLGPNARPLGQVQVGFGNNGEDRTEGCRYRNAIGTYLHGPILPKNPQLADFLIQTALARRYGNVALPPLNDQCEFLAHQSARKRAFRTR